VTNAVERWWTTVPSELREALTATGASALVPKIIDPILVELQRRYAPLVRALPTQEWNADQYYFNQRTVTPAGGFVPDGGARTVSNSTYVQNVFQMKHLQVVGAITGYAQEVTRQVIGDLRETEIEASLKGLYWDVETAILWGNAASTTNGAQPQFDGLDTQVSNFSGGTQNALDKGGSTLTLAMLDELADMVESNAAMPVFDDTWMFVLSNSAVSKVAQLLTPQQRFNDTVEVSPGLLVPTYRNIPLIKTSFLSQRTYSVGTVTSTTATTGGSIPASTTYRYMVSAVIARQGEIAPSAEVSQATGTGTATNTIMLAFSPPTGNDGLAPILYKVYRSAAGGAAGSETFLGYVDATVGLSSDGVTPIPTTSIVDTGTSLVPQNNTTVPGTLPAQYYGTNASLLPPGAGQETIYLLSRDRNNVVRPYVREATPLDVYPTTASPDTMPYAMVTDTVLAIRAAKFCGRLTRVSTAV
jgi:hypothetical protein